MAALLRALHLDWGLPDVYEEATPALIASQFWGPETGEFDFNPRFFNYPGLAFYLHFFFQSAYFLLASALGAIPTLEHFRHLIREDFAALVLLGRGATVLFDLSSVLVSYLLGRKLGDVHSGLLAALLVACNAIHIRISQMVIVDTPLALLILISLLFILDCAEKQRLRDYLNAGCVLGLAASCKYTGALLALPFASCPFSIRHSNTEIAAAHSSSSGSSST